MNGGVVVVLYCIWKCCCW